VCCGTAAGSVGGAERAGISCNCRDTRSAGSFFPGLDYKRMYKNSRTGCEIGAMLVYTSRGRHVGTPCGFVRIRNRADSICVTGCVVV